MHSGNKLDKSLRKSKEQREMKNSTPNLQTERIVVPFGEL